MSLTTPEVEHAISNNDGFVNPANLSPNNNFYSGYSSDGKVKIETILHHISAITIQAMWSV